VTDCAWLVVCCGGCVDRVLLLFWSCMGMFSAAAMAAKVACWEEGAWFELDPSFWACC